jgi:ABC-type transporter Mla subunit MlaD
MLEGKLGQQEHTTINVAQKGDQVSRFLGEGQERLEHRVIALEQALNLANAERARYQDALNKIELSNQRLNDEFRAILNGYQTDVQYKIDISTKSLMDRLMSEQEQRQRQIEEVRNRSDQGDKLAQERIRDMSDELRDRNN